MFSAIISFAPLIASSTLKTPFSSSINSFAISSIFLLLFCSNIICANGSSPLALAIVALVFFFCLYGL